MDTARYESLKATGINMDMTLSRFMNNEMLMERFLKKFVSDPSFGEWEAAAQTGDVATAFRAAHTLKGVAGNLGMDHLMALVAPLVEELRVGDGKSLNPEGMAEVRAEYEKICAALKENFQL